MSARRCLLAIELSYMPYHTGLWHIRQLPHIVYIFSQFYYIITLRDDIANQHQRGSLAGDPVDEDKIFSSPSSIMVGDEMGVFL